MPYNPTTGIITQPTGSEDVKPALGVREPDLARLCTHQNINLLSKYKPTSAIGLFKDDWWEGMSTGADEGETEGDHNAYYTGMDYAGIFKPYLVIDNASLMAGNPPVFLNNITIETLSAFKLDKWQNSLSHRREKNKVCYYRITDFDGYIRSNKQRNDLPQGMADIMSIDSTFYYQSGNTAVISCQFAFALATQAEGNAALLGMKDIFGVDLLNGKAYYGFLVHGENLNNRGLLTMIYISGKGIGDDNTGTGPDDSGLTYLTNVSITADCIATAGSKSNPTQQKFYPTEQVTVVPIIARRSLEGKWFIANLNWKMQRGQTMVTVPQPTADMSMLYFSSAQITLRIWKDTSSRHCFAVSGLRFVVNTLNSSVQSGKITFGDNGYMEIGPADGNTNVNTYTRGIMGSASDAMGRYMNAQVGTITQINAIINNYSAGGGGADPVPVLKVIPAGSATSYKISISFSYFRPVLKNNVWSMHKFRCEVTKTIDISSVSTQERTETLPFTQSDTEHDGYDPDGYWEYFFGLAERSTGGEVVSLVWYGSSLHLAQTTEIYSYRKHKNTGVLEPVDFSFKGVEGVVTPICNNKGSVVQEEGGHVIANAILGAVYHIQGTPIEGHTYTYMNSGVTQAESGKQLTISLAYTYHS